MLIVYNSCGKVYNCCPVGEHMQKNDLLHYLQHLGFADEEARLYLAMVEHGASTPLALSRVTGINRTKVYRVLEEMKRRGFAIEEVGDGTTAYSPAPTERIVQLLRERQRATAELTAQWTSVDSQLQQLTLSTKAATRVKYYRGREGIEQMVWNVRKAKHEVGGYTFRDLVHFVGSKFMAQFVEEFTRRNLFMRDIYGDEYLASEPIQYGWGGHVSSRYLPKKVLAIPHQMDIYDEVVTFYSWVGDEVWGTEIWNPSVAQMQKQLFELAWEKAKKSSA